jgi:lipopolysaccharide/colanic/teichoic acid biosynthesis glycosyltransferase
MASWQLALKRLFDFVFALLGLVISSPLLLLIFVILVLQRDSKPIFSQERIGRNGTPFQIYKFRTMRLDAENGTPILAQKEDSRLTSIGKVLRKHHLDELPQLWNVLKGDMSFVGYRPERQYFIDQIMKHDVRYQFLYQMRPGITSDATIYNGYTDTMEKMLQRLRMDLDYFRRRSFWLDVKIVLTTLCFIVNGKKF